MRELEFWRRIRSHRPIDNGRPVETEKRETNLGSCFPIIIFAFEIVIEEPLQIIGVVWLVEIMPFLRAVEA